MFTSCHRYLQGKAPKRLLSWCTFALVHGWAYGGFHAFTVGGPTLRQSHKPILVAWLSLSNHISLPAASPAIGRWPNQYLLKVFQECKHINFCGKIWKAPEMPRRQNSMQLRTPHSPMQFYNQTSLGGDCWMLSWRVCENLQPTCEKLRISQHLEPGGQVVWRQVVWRQVVWWQVVWWEVVWWQVVWRQVVCDGRRRREREAVEAADGMQNQKQEPHTKMWGKRGSRSGSRSGRRGRSRGKRSRRSKRRIKNRRQSKKKKKKKKEEEEGGGRGRGDSDESKTRSKRTKKQTQAKNRNRSNTF